MKTKQLLLVSILIILLFSFISGCFEEEFKTDRDKLIGTWKAQDSHYRQYVFYKNGTCLITTANLKGTFVVDNNEKKLYINQTSPNVKYIFNYKINYDGTKLTLTNTDNYDSHVYRKQ